jgi:nucleotide-binding universal stress UspA family protein
MKIYFTFDPFEQNIWNRDQLKNLIAVFSSSEDELTAAYVSSRAEVQLTTAYDVLAKDRYTSYPEKLIQAELKDLGLSKAKIKVIHEKSLSQTSAIKSLSMAAKKAKADIIIISTNAKSMLPRLVFGSFAETLVHLSKTDLLVYHQKTKVVATGPKTIVYAHDLSLKGEKGLIRACEYALKWDARLVVIHVGLPEEKEGPLEKKIKLKLRKIEKQLSLWEIDSELVDQYSWDDAPSLIMDTATDQKATMIALAAESLKNNETLLGGSVVRKILRESNIPTLVLKI